MRKKAFMLLLLTFTAAFRLSASTDPKTAALLDRINKYYYCLPREGLKSFSCDAAFTIPDSKTNTFELHYTFLYLGPGYTPVLNFDKKYATTAKITGLLFKLSSVVNPLMKIWGLFSTQELFDPGAAKGGYTAARTSSRGFMVTAQEKSDKFRMYFDAGGLAHGIIADNGKEQVKMALSFTPEKHGSVMTGLNILSSTGQEPGMTVGCSIKYAEEQGFLLPSSVLITIVERGKTTHLLYTMSNYRIRDNRGGTVSDPVEDIRTVPASEEKPGAKHFFWVVRSKTGVVYLLGSVHIRPDISLPVPEAVLKCFDASQYVGFESDISQKGQKNTDIPGYIKEHGMYPADDSLRKHLTSSQWQAVQIAVYRDGGNIAHAARLKPVYLGMVLSQLAMQKNGIDNSKGVDQIFLRRADSENKPVFGLERWDEPFRAMDSLSGRDQAHALMENLQETDNNITQYDRIISDWSEGNTEALDRELNRNMSPEDRHMMDKIIRDRNTKWIPQFQKMLSTRNAYFVIVGSGHLVGRNGVPNWLRYKGYSVRQY